MQLTVFAEGTHAKLGIVDVFTDLRIVWRYDTPGEMEFVVPITPLLKLQPGMVIWPSGGA